MVSESEPADDPEGTHEVKMDPQQTAEYAKAHDELHDLFREIARHGRVTAHELQHAVLPYTAGDAKRDLQELVDDMIRKQTSLDESNFIRVMWKKMYLTNVVYTTQQTGGRLRHAACSSGRSGDGDEEAQAINIPLAHVIVSIKRRAQLKQFANYYASRGISGADHLRTASDNPITERSTPRHLVQAQKKRQAATAAAAQVASITALRNRTSSNYDIIAYVYDTDTLCMRAHRMFTGVEMASVANCSRLHGVVSTQKFGTTIVSSRHFVDHVRARASRLHDNQENRGSPERKIPIKHSKVPVDASVAKDLYLTKLDDLGIRNVVALGVGRGSVVATTERRVHCWNALDSRSTATAETPSAPQLFVVKADSAEDANAGLRGIPLDVIEFLEDEGDCFGHVPLLKRTKVVSDVAGIQQVACGDQFAIGVAEGLELYSWGTAPLGRGKTTPTRLPFFPLGDVTGTITVGRVACGLRHVLLVTSHGGVFAWGINVHGQLGVVPHGSALDAAVEEPTEVKLPSLALDIACGDHHSVVLGDKGSLFAWGNNWHGQLGHDPEASETGCIFAPTKVNWWASRDIQRGDERQETPSNLDEVASSSPGRQSQKPSSPSKNVLPRVYLLTAIGDTTAIVSEQGHVFVWGKCVPPGPVAGACGIVARWRPQRVDIPDELLDAERQAVATGSTSVSTSTPIISPWASIAIANGLVLLTRHTLT